MKKDWERSTRICDYSQLFPELKEPIEAELKELDEALDILFCIKTESKKIKTGLFAGKKKIFQVAAIVTPRWLIQAVDQGDGDKPYTLFHYLDKMELSFTTVELGRKLNIDDYGIDVLSTVRGRLERGSLFLGLERGAAAEQFIDTLKEAIRAANQ